MLLLSASFQQWIQPEITTPMYNYSQNKKGMLILDDLQSCIIDNEVKKLAHLLS